jgi:hypothetical protein
VNGPPVCSFLNGVSRLRRTRNVSNKAVDAMITLTQCAAFAGLTANEFVLGVSPSAKHQLPLSSYLVHLGRGQAAVREIIVADLRIFLDLGVSQRAADLLIVLRLFLSDYPDARCVSPRWEGWDLIQKSSAPRRLAPRRDEKSIAVRRSPPIDEKGGSKKSPEAWRKSCPCGN